MPGGEGGEERTAPSHPSAKDGGRPAPSQCQVVVDTWPLSAVEVCAAPIVANLVSKGNQSP